MEQLKYLAALPTEEVGCKLVCHREHNRVLRDGKIIQRSTDAEYICKWSRIARSLVEGITRH